MAARPVACLPVVPRARKSVSTRKAAFAQSAKAPASNAAFRGGKGLHEGGVRVPAFVNWPAKLKPAVINEPVHMVDVMPTLLALAGGQGNPDHQWMTETTDLCWRMESQRRMKTF